MLHAVVHAADIQDRDGSALVMAMLSGLFPFRGKIYADGAIRVENPKPQSSGLSIRSTSRSSNAQTPSNASWCFQNAGLSSGRSRG
jgi:hypothetical protein